MFSCTELAHVYNLNSMLGLILLYAMLLCRYSYRHGDSTTFPVDWNNPVLCLNNSLTLDSRHNETV